ncbi:MAG TPA: cytochrome-c peroxidase [Dongiaceae bacterium]|nr:cytochrome-c peroxidase [Dongiaceae bacterium]
MIRHPFIAALLVATSAHFAAAGETPKAMSRAEAYRQAAELEALGHDLFFDPILSGSGKESCSTCHAPDRGFAPANALPVQFGGSDMKSPGTRAAPSLTYLQATPQFTEHYFDNEDEGDESVDNGPTGGLTWDGRADRPRDQAKIPLLSANEMANPSAEAVVDRIARSKYAAPLRTIYGDDVFGDTDRAFTGILTALETFQQDPATFYPYSSKYDAYLQGKAKLTDQEARGLALFNDETKGNCASCHLSEIASDGTPPQFSDFGMIALGVPRNPEIPANKDPAYFDLGLCGPLRTDFKGEADYCGLFKTPSLRNVALRQTFMHNGYFHSLRKVVEFYATRDTSPEKWYPHRANGSIDIYDDLPEAYRANLNTDPPFGGKPGDKPALDDREIDDIVAFLGTLTDGYRP